AAIRPAEPAATDAAGTDEDSISSEPSALAALKDAGAPAAHLYFGADPIGFSVGRIEPWRPGEAPEPRDAIEPIRPPVRTVALPPGTERAPPGGGEGFSGGETIAPKGEVTGADQRPMSPVERLKLDEKNRAKAEKCLTAAIYFEARGESVRGQIAV